MKLPDRTPIEPPKSQLDAGDVSLFFPRHEWPETGIFAMTLVEFREATKEDGQGDLFKRDIYEAKRKLEKGHDLAKVARDYGMRPQDLKRHLKKEI